MDGVLAVRDGGDVEDGIRLGQGVIAGMVAERTFVAQRLARANVAFDDKVGVGQNGFQVRQSLFKARPIRRNTSNRPNTLRLQTLPIEVCLVDSFPTVCILTDTETKVRVPPVSTITKIDSVWFTTKGQVVIPAWLRKQFDIEDGTKAVVQATPEGILLKPVTAALIKHGRGILKRKPGDKPLADEWAEHKKQEKELEERHAR